MTDPTGIPEDVLFEITEELLFRHPDVGLSGVLCDVRDDGARLLFGKFLEYRW